MYIEDVLYVVAKVCDLMFRNCKCHFLDGSCMSDGCCLTKLIVFSMFLLVCVTLQVAERVAAERAESVGNGNSCGYQIRLQR